MARLIDPMSLKAAIVVERTLGTGKPLEDIIDDEPSVDAVEVVRCKDCKHFASHQYCFNDQWWDEHNTKIVRENDFCSYGEKQ